MTRLASAKQNPESKTPSFMAKVNETYASESSANLVDNFTQDFDPHVGELFWAFGPWLGPVIWVFLQCCSPDLKSEILNTLSPFRSGVKSVATLDQTAGMAGMPVKGNLATGLGAGVGIAMGALITKFINPEISKIEERLKLRTRLNKLLLKHLGGSDSRIPQGLSPIQLIHWLEDPFHSDFADLPLRSVTEDLFQDYHPEEIKRLTWLKLFAEIMAGVYTTSVANVDLGLMGVSSFLNNHISLGFNLITVSALVASHHQIAHHHVEGLALSAKQSCLAGKREVKFKKVTAAYSAATPSPQPEQFKALTEYADTSLQLQQCEKRLERHKKVDMNNLHLTNAALKGFQEGGETVSMFTGIPISVLVLTHVVSAGFLPLYLAVLGITIVAGIYCGYKRYQQKKQEIAQAEKPKPTAAAPAQHMASQTQPTTFWGKLFKSSALKPATAAAKQSQSPGFWGGLFNHTSKKPIQAKSSVAVEMSSFSLPVII